MGDRGGWGTEAMREHDARVAAINKLPPIHNTFRRTENTLTGKVDSDVAQKNWIPHYGNVSSSEQHMFTTTNVEHHWMIEQRTIATRYINALKYSPIVLHKTGTAMSPQVLYLRCNNAERQSGINTIMPVVYNTKVDSGMDYQSIRHRWHWDENTRLRNV